MTPDDLRQQLAERDVTQRQLARALGVHAGTVNRWCRGRRAIERFATQAIVAYLGTVPAAPQRHALPAITRLTPATVRALRKRGHSDAEIARASGKSRQRVGQVGGARRADAA